MVSGTSPLDCSRSLDQCNAKDYQMRGFKCRTLATIFVSAFLGAALYCLLYAQLSPPPSHSWILDHEAGRPEKFLAKFRDIRGERGGEDLRKFKAKIEEINKKKPRIINNGPPSGAMPYYNYSRSGDFKIVWPFHFPQPKYSFRTDQLLQSEWVMNLQDFLKTVDGKQVSVVTSSIEHTDILFNWLISAYLVSQPPLENIMVLTLDKSLHDLAVSHGFASLYVSPEMMIDPRAKITRVFSQVHIVRLAVVRLMNHYGYDVVNYDCDAILLKNPQTIFDSHKDADMIGTFGKGPGHLFNKWGVTLNTGVMLLRSNAKLEAYWEAMNVLKEPTTDDQGNINKALEALKVKWINLKRTDNIDFITNDIFGVVDIKRPKPMKMVVMLMSFSTVCRQTCDPKKRDDYFVWHAVAIKENRTVERKMSQARVGNAWFLSNQWQSITQQNPTLKGVEWLKAVVDPNLAPLIKTDLQVSTSKSTSANFTNTASQQLGITKS